MKLSKVEEAESWTGKVEFVRSWKSEKLKMQMLNLWKVEKFHSWKCKCWIYEKLKIEKLKKQGWKCKVKIAEVETDFHSGPTQIA